MVGGRNSPGHPKLGMTQLRVGAQLERGGVQHLCPPKLPLNPGRVQCWGPTILGDAKCCPEHPL